MKNFQVFILFVITLSLISFCSCSTSETMPQNIKSQGEFFIDDVDMESGDLKCKVTGSSYYKNINDAGLKYADLVEAKDWIDPKTGEMLNGSVFVLVNVNIQNENAVPNDKRYDNTTFRIDGLQLVNITEKVTSDNYQSYYMNYFSNAGKCSENIFAYKLRNGDSDSFTIGYIADTDKVEDLYLCTSSGNINDTFIKLNFSD